MIDHYEGILIEFEEAARKARTRFNIKRDDGFRFFRNDNDVIIGRQRCKCGAPIPVSVAMERHRGWSPRTCITCKVKRAAGARDVAKMASRAKSAGRSKSSLDEGKVREIRRLKGSGFSASNVGGKFGISTQSVYDIWKNKVWKEVV